MQEKRRSMPDYFNPRSLVGNDGLYLWSRTPGSGFQSTFPRGERPQQLLLITVFRRFQSTFPRGGRHQSGHLFCVVGTNFNPRSLVGNDGVAGTPINQLKISIHVPSWGTTLPFFTDLWGLTDFNPRSLVGNDMIDLLQILVAENISIHVPSWGTTRTQTLRQVFFQISIHVPSWGTTAHSLRIAAKAQFQSTFPRGERLQIFTNILCFFMQ